MQDLAAVLQTYGGWGLSAVLLCACARLYTDLRATERLRLQEAREFGERLYRALNDAVKVVTTIERPQLTYRGRGEADYDKGRED